MSVFTICDECGEHEPHGAPHCSWCGADLVTPKLPKPDFAAYAALHVPAQPPRNMVADLMARVRETVASAAAIRAGVERSTPEYDERMASL